MSIFDESQLILSSQGNIYHLDVSKDNLADTIITVGDPQRVSSVTQYFDSIDFVHEHREFSVATGVYRGTNLSVISTGMGTQNIDIFFNELDALFNIDLKNRKINNQHTPITLVRIGTSGSIDASIPVGSYLVSSHAIDLTGVMSYYKYSLSPQEQQFTLSFSEQVKNRLPLQDYPVFAGDSELVNVFLADEEFKQGVTATCNGFYASQGRSLRATSPYSEILACLQSCRLGQNNITNLEMETAGLYGFANLFGHKCCSVNLILANRVASKSTETKTGFIKDIDESLKTMIVKVLDILIMYRGVDV